MAPPGSTYEEEAIELNTARNVIVTYYLNPSEFYIQSLTLEEEFKQMMNDIQTYYVQKFWCKDPPGVSTVNSNNSNNAVHFK